MVSNLNLDICILIYSDTDVEKLDRRQRKSRDGATNHMLWIWRVGNLFSGSTRMVRVADFLDYGQAVVVYFFQLEVLCYLGLVCVKSLDHKFACSNCISLLTNAQAIIPPPFFYPPIQSKIEWFYCSLPTFVSNVLPRLKLTQIVICFLFTFLFFCCNSQSIHRLLIAIRWPYPANRGFLFPFWVYDWFERTLFK